MTLEVVMIPAEGEETKHIAWIAPHNVPPVFREIAHATFGDQFHQFWYGTTDEPWNYHADNVAGDELVIR